MHTNPQPAISPQPVHLVVVPHTHWDREWYQPFQEFRARLVRLIDRLLDLLDSDPAFAHFHFDGQTIVLEDYLEIRPDRRARLCRLIRAGRIAVGPWYILPDELLVSGESLIRNLQIGHRLAAEFGAPTKIGYLPDEFGHCAQMPQILAGFGIDNAVVWRGVGADVTQTLFTWEGLDGTSAFTVYLPMSGYSNGRNLPESVDELREEIGAIIAEQASFRRIPSLLVMNGTDHQEPHATLPESLAAATHGLEGVTYEVAPLAQFIEQLHDPASPNFHRWLTAQEFGERFGPAPADVETITLWLESHGFAINVVYPSGMLIDFSGTAGLVHQAFHTPIHHLDVNGVPHIANMSEPQLPAALATAVVGIVSLHDFLPHSMHRLRPQYTFGGGATQALVPGDLATIYNLNPLFNAGISGQGQTVVVIEDTDVFSTADWNTFRSTFGLSSFTSGSFTQVHPAPPSGNNNCRAPGVNADDIEAILDAEWASAAAPSAAIQLAACANTRSSFGGLLAFQNLINGSSPPTIISIS